ncbi:ankyrin-3-like [Haliotis asinina]|uniref:ankyrin-3-like n=1 Tax=Haliotis asinina TaxID=109174 RepID=UPI003531D29C
MGIDCKDCIGRTPMMWAATERHRDVVQLLVTNGANMSLVDRFGINILHSACLGGDVEVVKHVLSQNMLDINSREQCGRTAVMLAAENGHKDVVEMLVDKGADLSLVDETEDNVLHCACRGGDAGVVKYILSKNRVDIDRRGLHELTPIMMARRCKHREVVELLLSKRADGSLRYYNHKNMLLSASREGDMEVVKFVLSQNIVDVDSRGPRKKTPVMLAAQYGYKEVVELLVENGADLSLVYDTGSNGFQLACSTGRLEVVKYIIAQNTVDINYRGLRKKTAAMIAAESGHKEVVELLVENGADLSLAYDTGSNILHSACSRGRLEVVKYILSQNIVDINCRGWMKKTPVMTAAECGHEDVVELLVENGADLSLACSTSNNILHLACSKGYVEVLKYVLSQNTVDINSRGRSKKTPAMIAAECGHEKVVELLMEKGANLSLTCDTGSNILHLACSKGRLEVLKYILSQNIVDINSRGRSKKTPAMIAAECGHEKVVELLMEKGANLSLTCDTGSNILHLACSKGRLEVLKYILSQNIVDINSRGRSKKTPAMIAAECGHEKVVELLVEKGANLSLACEKGSNILHLACSKGRLEVVKYILSQNIVDINCRGRSKKTPAMTAAQYGYKEVVELLMEKGANLSLVNDKSRNILHVACSRGRLEVVKYVLSQNIVDINSRGRSKKTPAMIAAESGYKEVVELLMEKGANMSLVSDRGSNILHLACSRGRLEVVKYVLSQNIVDINSRGGSKKTSAMNAGESGYKEVVELLVENGADLSLVCDRGSNILHLACSKGHLEVVKYVISQNIVDINGKEIQNMTPVMMAAKSGHKEVVEFLVSRGADMS